MSFRKNNKSQEAQWMKKHKPFMLEAGVPVEIVNNERMWNYVLLHGDDGNIYGWSAASIAPAHALRLIELLKEIHDCEVGLELIQVLRNTVHNAK